MQLSIVFREAILALTKAEYKGYTVFLAGHGLGGITPFFFYLCIVINVHFY
jgi:hypothetical protein